MPVPTINRAVNLRERINALAFHGTFNDSSQVIFNYMVGSFRQLVIPVKLIGEHVHMSELSDSRISTGSQIISAIGAKGIIKIVNIMNVKVLVLLYK